MLEYDKIDTSEGIDIKKNVKKHLKNVIYVNFIIL